MIDKLQAHYGFTRMPFGRDLAPGMLHRHAAHNEACARITWCIAERAIGVITGEVGAGKTVSVRTVLAGLDASRHTIIYLPNPMIGIRGLHEMIVATFGGQPDRSYSRLTAQASAMLAAERDERGKTPVLVIDFYRPAPLTYGTSGEAPFEAVAGVLTHCARDVRHVGHVTTESGRTEPVALPTSSLVIFSLEMRALAVRRQPTCANMYAA